MNALLLAVAVWCLVFVESQRIRPRSLCMGNQIYLSSGSCSKNYYRCDSNMTIRGYCPEDMSMGPNNTCEPRSECGSPTVSRRGRRKRQSGSGSSGRCNQKFDCPSNLVFYIYPDWDDCTRFYTCREGVVESVSCSNFNFQYYNPDLFSCEVDLSLGPFTPQNNVCINRAVQFGK